MNPRLDGAIKETYAFHKRDAPGIIIGCYMVDYAMELLGPCGDKLNAVVETDYCLPDALQIMTGCTAGNKYLRIRDDLGRYALSLYDRKKKEGVRVFIDLGKIKDRGLEALYNFHTRKRDPRVHSDPDFRKESGKAVVAEFLGAGREVLSYQRIRVNLPSKPEIYPAAVCSSCKESFITKNASPQGLCPYCSSKDEYYTAV